MLITLSSFPGEKVGNTNFTPNDSLWSISSIWVRSIIHNKISAFQKKDKKVLKILFNKKVNQLGYQTNFFRYLRNEESFC